jgi:hypothetical protein
MQRFLFALVVPMLAAASILPDTIGPYHRTDAGRVILTDRALWDEYGLKNFESATFENGPAKFTATLYQLQDSTGALAAFEWQRPAKSIPSKAAALASETPDGLVLLYGNYVLLFAGYKPTAPEIGALAHTLPNVDGTPLPTLIGYLPLQDIVPNSQRYVTGPVSLQKFDPSIPPSIAAFRYGSEAQLGVFHSPKGDLTLAVFNYPTPQIAMQKLTDFQNLPGAVVKRTGPLIAVAMAPTDPDEAERLLSQVQYRADITMQEHIPTRRDNIGNLVITAFVLTGLALAACVIAGLAFGGFRAFLRRGNRNPDADTIISLHLRQP